MPLSFSFSPCLALAKTSRLSEGEGARFNIVVDGVRRDAFVVRYHGRVHGYLNTCRHQGMNLDFGDGRFFDDAYDALVCRHHGARYQPETGACIDGPCAGGSLTRLTFEDRDGALWCTGVIRSKASKSVLGHEP